MHSIPLLLRGQSAFLLCGRTVTHPHPELRTLCSPSAESAPWACTGPMGALATLSEAEGTPLCKGRASAVAANPLLCLRTPFCIHPPLSAPQAGRQPQSMVCVGHKRALLPPDVLPMRCVNGSPNAGPTPDTESDLTLCMESEPESRASVVQSPCDFSGPRIT